MKFIFPAYLGNHVQTLGSYYLWISRGSKTRGGKLFDHGALDIDREARRPTATSPAEAGAVRETSTARAPRRAHFHSR